MTSRSTKRLADAAVGYGQAGWSIFPVRVAGKAPATSSGHKDATNDPNRIRAWWASTDYNIGVNLEAMNWVVVDVDQLSAVARLMRHGFLLPRTLTAITGSAGCHYYYRQPDPPLRNSAGRVAGFGQLPGADVRGAGGYTILPPSVHPNGETYSWLGRAWATKPVAAPDWMREPETTERIMLWDRFEAVSSAYMEKALSDECQKVANAPVGQRNDTLNRAAFNIGQLVFAGLDETVAGNRLLRAGLQAGLGEVEAVRTSASGLASGFRCPR